VSKRVLGCDLDGVVFQFNKSYCDLFRQKFDIQFPSETSLYPYKWDYESELATKEQIDEVWKDIRGPQNYNFWRNLPVYEGAPEFLKLAHEQFDAVHYITARSGPRAKEATEDALRAIGVKNPHVVVANYKVPHLIALGCTDFLDDRDKNFEDVLYAEVFEGYGLHKMPHLWMLDRPWNRLFIHPQVTRIVNPTEMLLES